MSRKCFSSPGPKVAGFGASRPPLYPSPCEDVPRLRKAYWYYLGQASFSGLCQEILVRRAQCPVPNTVELPTPVNIRTKFCVADNDILDIDVQ